MKQLLLCIALLFAFLGVSQTKNSSVRTFTSFDGLEFDSVSDMEFDDDGFLWLGGVNLDVREIIQSDQRLVIQRFDGQNFHSFPIPDGPYKANRILGINKRNDGKFYINVQIQGGHMLYLFDPVTTQFKVVSMPNSADLAAGISKVFNYQDKNYILFQEETVIGLYELDQALNFSLLFEFTSTENRFLVEASTVFLPFEDYVLIGDDNFPPKLFRWDGDFVKIIHPEKYLAYLNDKAPKYYIDEAFQENGIYYAIFFADPSLYYFEESSLEFLPVADTNLANDHVSVLEDSNGRNAVVTNNNGLVAVKSFEDDAYFTTTFTAAIAKTGIIRAASRDLKEGVWLSTDGQLNYFEFPSKTVKTYLPDQSIRAITKWKDNTAIVATETDGWYKLDLTNSEITPWEIFENGRPFVPKSARNLFVEGDSIWSNSSSRIFGVDFKTRNSTSYRHYPVITMVRPTDSTIVYGTNGYHLMEFNTHKREHRPLLLTDSLYIYDLELQGDVLVGATDKGVLTYNLQNKTHQFYGANYVDDPYLLMADYEQDYGYLLGSRSGKIYAFDPSTKTFSTIYEDQLKAGIATILFDEEDWWINTFNGYVVFNPEKGTSTRFSEKDGFSNNEANRYSALNTEDGFLVGTIKGLNFFHPEDLKPKENVSKLVLTKVRNFDTESNQVIDHFNREKFTFYNAITLPSEFKELQLDFALTDNLQSSDHRYRYRLDDEDWIQLKQQNSIRFANLAAGKYNLEIEALDFSGNKIGDSLKLFIDSKNFFYKTPWFFALVLIAIVTWLSWLLQEAKLRTKLRESFSQRLLQSQEQERTRIAKELHDSVGQQLTLIKRKAQNSQESEISDLTHNALEEVRSISRGLYPSVLKQLGLTESIEQLIYDLDEETDLFFSSELDTIDPFLSGDQTLNFYRFIQEALNNILKHSEATSVTINIRKEQSQIVAEIIDNGKGFDPMDSGIKKSLGLQTMSERIRILRGILKIDSKPGQGTNISAKIPIKND